MFSHGKVVLTGPEGNVFFFFFFFFFLVLTPQTKSPASWKRDLIKTFVICAQGKLFVTEILSKKCARFTRIYRLTAF